MPLVHGSTSGLLIAGTEITGYFRQLDRTGERDLHDTTMFGHSEHRFFPGLQAGSVSLGGLFDPTADALLAPFGSAAAPAEQPFSFAPEGFGAGKRVLFGMVRQASYKVGGSAQDMVEATVELTGSTSAVLGAVKAGGFYSGISFGVAATRAASWAVTLDRGAAALTASQKFAAIVHSSVLPTSGGSLFVEWEHSADNVTYVSLADTAIAWGPSAVGGAFNYPTSNGGVAIVPTAQTINRYIRQTLTFSGTPVPGLPSTLQQSVAVFS